jgi:hypothetical protein
MPPRDIGVAGIAVNFQVYMVVGSLIWHHLAKSIFLRCLAGILQTGHQRPCWLFRTTIGGHVAKIALIILRPTTFGTGGSISEEEWVQAAIIFTLLLFFTEVGTWLALLLIDRQPCIHNRQGQTRSL